MISFREKGISLLIPTQNVEQTVELCLRSLKDFPDEIIVVDNGSTDGTIDIVKSIQHEIPNMQFYEAPFLKDLYENRQYAYERSRFNWIVRFDSDYIAHTSGVYCISKLRNKILNTKRAIRPKAFGITLVNLFPDFWHTGLEIEKRDGNPNIHVPPPIGKLPARIIQCFPGMKFVRLGRWEGVRWQSRLAHESIDIPYLFHCNFKSKLNYLIRSERTNWRELGDFLKYPTKESYVLDVIRYKFGVSDLLIAADIHWNRNVEPYLQKYDANQYFDYPEILKVVLNNCN